MATREISIEDAIKTLRNIVAPPRQVEEEYSEEDEYFQGLRDGLKGKTKNRNKKKKNKSGQSKKGSLNNNTNNDKNPNVLTRRASISKYGSGDLFGTRGNYEQSLLYRSRLGGIPNTYKKPQNIANTTIFASKRRTSILPSEMGLGGAREETWKDIFRVKAEAGRNDLESKRDCTSAINLWASNFELHSSLLEFGIVEAVDKMVEKNEDDEVLENCIETVFQLSTNREIIHELNRKKLYTTAMSMLLQAEELDLLAGMVNCSSIILNLSNDIDIADKYISSGIIIELNRIYGRHPMLETHLLQTIFNIVNTLDRTTHWMHDVLYYVLTLLKKHKISQENLSLIMKIISRSSVLLEIPQHLCEKDITGTLRQVVERMKKWKPEYSIEILRYTATTAFFISLSIEASTKMVDAGGLPLLRELLNIVHDDDVICVCVATLGNMARSRLVRNKLVQDGAVKLLAVEAERCALQLQQNESGIKIGKPTNGYEKLLTMCVAALATLAQDDESAIQVAIQGGMRLMIIVATYAKNINLRSQAIVALCNLLSSKDTHVLIESVGSQVQSSINIFALYYKQILANDISLAGYFATVFNNMTLSTDGRKMIQNVDLAEVVLWVALMAEGDDDAIELCLSCIYNCTLDLGLLKTFQNEKHIGSIIEIMKISKGTRVDELCIATLHKLAEGFQNAGAIFAGQGAMDEIIDLTASLAPRTRELAVTTLSQMTLDDNNIEVLVEDGAIRALAAVAKTSDELAQRATAALSNIAGHKHGMYIRQLLSAGAVETMIKLSGSKDPEVRRLSAHTICHLVSCAEGPRKQMIEAGAVNALVLTGLIRSSEEDIITRKACCCAMYTLCSTGNIDKLGDWRVVWSATCMMNLGLDFCIMALTILANLSAYPNGRHLISNKQTVEEMVLFATSRSKIKIPVEVMKIIALVFHNTLCGFGRPTERTKKVDNFKSFDDFDVELEIEREHEIGDATQGNADEEATNGKKETGSIVDLSNLNTLFQGKEGKEHRSACRIIAKSSGTRALTSLARLPFPKTREQCVAALAIICTTDDTHEQFLNDGGFKILNEVSHLDKLDVGTRVCWQIRQYCLTCAVYAALKPKSRFRAVRDGALEMIVPIVESSRSDETDELCCRCVELFAQDVSARALMIDSGVTQAMDNLTKDADLPHKVFINRVKRFAKTLLYVCSVDLEERDNLVDYGVIELMSRFAQIPSERIAAEVVESLSLLCECEDRLEAIIHDGGLKVVQDVLSIGLKDEFGTHSHEIFERCAFIVGNFATNKNSLLFLAANDIVPTVRFVSKTASSDSVQVCAKVIGGLCLEPDARERLIEKGHYRDILVMYNRLVQQAGHENEAALLALSLLNMTKTEDKDAQKNIVTGCEASILLINAQKVTDEDREKLYDLLPHLPPSDAIFTNDGEEDEMVVPLFYSPAEKVSWPVYNFFTTPKVPEPADLKAKPTIAPRWIPRQTSRLLQKGQSSSDSNGNSEEESSDLLNDSSANINGISMETHKPETNLSSVPPRINIKNSLTSPFYEKNFVPYDMCNLDLYFDEDYLDDQFDMHEKELLNYNVAGSKLNKPRHSTETNSQQQKKGAKKVGSPSDKNKLLDVDNISTFIGGIDANDAPQAYVESLMEVVVDRLAEEPERMFTIARKGKSMAESKMEEKKTEISNDALALQNKVDSNNDKNNNNSNNKNERIENTKNAIQAFAMPGIPSKWSSPKSPVELRGLTKTLDKGRKIHNDHRKSEAKKFVELMRKKTLASIAKDKRKLAVKLASTLQDIENERRAKLTPKRRRNKSKGSSSMMSNSPTLPSISGSSNSVIIKSPKQSYSRIKVSKRG